MERDEQPTGEEDHERSVLDTVEALTGRTARVHLSGSDEEAQVAARPTALRKKGRGTYEILGEIARGGMGVVFRGRDTELGRDVALKVLDEGLARNPVVLQRFVEEAQIGGQLQHPGIVPVYELGLNADDRPFFTMKLVKGRTLSALLAERASAGDDRLRFLKVFESVCQTVAYAHSKGVIHRDLKPSNVMVGAFGEVQVVDWGLAKVLGREQAEDGRGAVHSHLTVIETVRSGSSSGASDSMVGSVMGTPAYMPPEQASGEVDKLDARSDVFALGAILCEILTGAPPYRAPGDDSGELVRMAAKAKLDDAKQRIEDASADEALKEICLECLTPARAARPQDAGEVAAAVHDHLVSSEKRAQQAEIKAAEERRRRRLTVALAATVLVAVAAVGGGWLWIEGQRAERVAELERLFAEERDTVLDLQDQGRFDDALAVATSALRATEAGEADAALRDRAASLVEQASARVEQHRAELALALKNRRLAQASDELRLREVSLVGGLGERDELASAYARLFEDYGIDIDADDLTPALEAMRESGAAETFAHLLDNWARHESILRPEDPWAAERLQHVASDLDPHPLRNQLRRAILESDLDLLLALESDIDRLPPSSIWLLGTAAFDMLAWSSQRGETVRRINRRGTEIYPDDFLLNVLMAFSYRQADRPDLGMPYALAAHALRPDDAFAMGILGELQHRTGKLPEAERTLLETIRLRPDWRGPHAILSMNAIMLGDYALLEEVCSGWDPAVGWSGAEEGVMIARFVRGDLDGEELVVWARERPSSEALVSAAYVLIDAPDVGRRRPELARQILTTLGTSVPDQALMADLAALVALRTGDGRAALDACLELEAAAVEEPTWTNHCFYRAQAHGLLGEADEAERWFELGDEAYARLTFARPEAWERADPTRYRADAAALLGR